MLVNEDQGMKDVADALERVTTVNGVSLPAAGEQGTFRRVTLHSTVDGVTDTQTAKRALDGFEPNVVIVLAGDEAVPFISDSELTSLAEPTAPSGAQRYYVVSHGLYNSPSLKSMTQGFADLNQRMLGINYAGATDKSLYQTYFTNLRAIDPLAVDGYENYYDAAHYAMLSIIATAVDVPTTQLTGTLAAKGFRRLIDVTTPSETFGLEPRVLPKIVDALEHSSESFEVLGTLGEPKFYERTSARHTGAAVWCLRVKPESGGELEFATDTVRFVEALNAFDAGPNHCFDLEAAE
jgi:hypothetical protein